MKTPITYYGGKQKMLPHILPVLPAHHLYCEPFAGGAAVYFAKPKSEVEVINDLNEALITFYRVMKNNGGELIKLVKSTLHSRSLHDKAWKIYQNTNDYSDVEIAWAVWLLCSQGFSGQISPVWGVDISKNTMCNRINASKSQFTETLCKRLENTQVECADALHIIKKYDRPDTFFYVDPPYYNSECAHYAGYTLEDFENLLALLSNIKGKFLLSSYPSEVLSHYTDKHGWHSKHIKQTISVSKSAKTKIEVLTANYQMEQTLPLLF